MSDEDVKMESVLTEFKEAPEVQIYAYGYDGEGATALCAMTRALESEVDGKGMLFAISRAIVPQKTYVILAYGRFTDLLREAGYMEGEFQDPFAADIPQA